MREMFASISLSFDDPAPVNREALESEMKGLGLSRGLTATEGQPVILPEFCFRGTFLSENRKEIHRQLYRGLNAALKKLGLHGRFFILVSPDVDWTCCHF